MIYLCKKMKYSVIKQIVFAILLLYNIPVFAGVLDQVTLQAAQDIKNLEGSKDSERFRWGCTASALV